MKNLLTKLLMLLALGLVSVGLPACTDAPEENETSVNATMSAQLVGEVDSNSAKVLLTMSGISEYAYVLKAASEPTPMAVVIFKDATKSGAVTKVESSEGSSMITLPDLEYETNYKLHIAAKVNAKKGGYYKDVVSVDFTTGNYTEEVTVVRLNYDGADIHIKFPEEVKQRGNKIKWMVTSYPAWRDWKPSSVRYATDSEMIQQSDNAYPAFLIHRDTTLRITDKNRIFTSPYDGSESEYYEFIAPGEPMYISIQEVLYTTDDQNSGWGAGWYGSPFLWDEFMSDYYAAAGSGGATPWSLETRATIPSEEDYWPENSWHKTLRLMSKQPDLLDATVAIGTRGYDGSSELSPKGGFITFTPEEGVQGYCVSIMPRSLYNQTLLTCLEGKKDRFQWFVTSYYAARSALAMTIDSPSPASIELGELFVDGATPGGTYDIMVTAMGGKDNGVTTEIDPTRQSFATATVEIPNYTLPAPEMKVTPLESDDPFLVKFNVKCTTPDTAPIEKASFACNYAREFSLYLGKAYKYTYSELIAMNTSLGIYFSDAEVKKMNSPEGCDVVFASREDALSGLVVKGWNYEGRPSNPDAEGSEAYAEARSSVIPAAERVESDLFEDLKGEWTATTTLHKVQLNYILDEEKGDGSYLKDEDGNYIMDTVRIQTEARSKVVIGEIPQPEELTQAVYDLYKGFTKAQVDAMYEEFKDFVDHNNTKERNQNRLLCLGLDFDELEVSYPDILNTQSAWDLFVSPTYSSSSVEDIFYDFGVKWHLQIAKDGSVFVPVNMNRILPASNWKGAEVHLFGYDPDSNQALMAPSSDSNDASTWPNLPVEVSEDKNTLTVKPYIYNGTTEEGEEFTLPFYPNFIINTNSIYEFLPMSGKIKGDIVLTRGWTEQTESEETVTTSVGVDAAATRAMKSSVAPVKSANGAKYVKMNIKSRTNFDARAALVKPSATEFTQIKVTKPIDVEALLSGEGK